MELQKSP